MSFTIPFNLPQWSLKLKFYDDSQDAQRTDEDTYGRRKDDIVDMLRKLGDSPSRETIETGIDSWFNEKHIQFRKTPGKNPVWFFKTNFADAILEITS